MTDIMERLVLYAMLGSIARKVKVLSEIDEHTQGILNPKYPKPSRAEIRSAARKNFKRTMHLLSKETKCRPR